MTQEYLPYNLTCESESDDSNIFWYDSDEDEDRFCGDVEWAVSLAAVAWEARRKLYAEEKIHTMYPLFILSATDLFYVLGLLHRVILRIFLCYQKFLFLIHVTVGTDNCH